MTCRWPDDATVNVSYRWQEELWTQRLSSPNCLHWQKTPRKVSYYKAALSLCVCICLSVCTHLFSTRPSDRDQNLARIICGWIWEWFIPKREGGREGGRKGGREGGREGRREGGKEGRKEPGNQLVNDKDGKSM